MGKNNIHDEFYDKYYKSLKTMPEPIKVTQLPRAKMNVGEIIKYAIDLLKDTN